MSSRSGRRRMKARAKAMKRALKRKILRRASVMPRLSSPPRLLMHDLDGNRIDRALLSPAKRALLEKLRPMVRPAYEGRGWPLHYALGYLLADGGLYCILTITHQVAYALHKYAPEWEAVKRELLYGKAYGATWMTEVQGGSDLGANRTLARREVEAYRLYHGDKSVSYTHLTLPTNREV